MIFNIIAWLLWGGLTGCLAGLIMGSRKGIVTNIIVGVIGAFLSGLLISFSNTFNTIGYNGYTLSGSIIGAAVFTLVFRVFKQT